MADPWVKEAVTTEYGTSKTFLMFPDGYRCFAQSFPSDSALAVTENGRKIIKAGTFFPANDATVKGIVFSDLDITDGPGTVAVLFEGDVRTNRLPVAPDAAAITALPKVRFFPDVVRS